MTFLTKSERAIPGDAELSIMVDYAAATGLVVTAMDPAYARVDDVERAPTDSLNGALVS